MCTGDEVRVHFIRNIDGEKEIVGILTAYNKDGITVTDENGNEKEFLFSDIAYVKLYLDFE